MKTIRSKQLVWRKGNEIELPRLGDIMRNNDQQMTVVAIRTIGKPYRSLHLGQFYGVIQEYEVDIK